MQGRNARVQEQSRAGLTPKAEQRRKVARRARVRKVRSRKAGTLEVEKFILNRMVFEALQTQDLPQ